MNPFVESSMEGAIACIIRNLEGTLVDAHRIISQLRITPIAIVKPTPLRTDWISSTPQILVDLLCKEARFKGPLKGHVNRSEIVARALY